MHVGITCGEATKHSIAAAVAATTTTTTTTTTIDSNDAKSAIQYENVDSLPQRLVLKTVPSYENIPITSPQQSNIEMNHCPAYGVLKGNHV